LLKFVVKNYDRIMRWFKNSLFPLEKWIRNLQITGKLEEIGGLN